MPRQDRITRLGCVVIGRNEGERLRRSLLSVIDKCSKVVYVDSGSTDDSVPLARSLNVDVVDLDMSIPFTAARARNAGYEHLHDRYPDLDFVQFVDGDCEIVEDWLEAGYEALNAGNDLGIVAGRVRERYPDASIYNQICDVEWDIAIGGSEICGGNAMMRVAALRQVGGFNPELIAGEEPELCLRLKRCGWRIEGLSTEMTIHDASMMHLSQWWKRNVRAGHAFAENAWMHGREPERHFVRESRRIWFYGAVVPAIALGGALPSLGASLLLLSGYPISVARAYGATKSRGHSSKEALAYSLSCTLGRLPELQGMVRFHLGRMLGRRSSIIEHKEPKEGPR